MVTIDVALSCDQFAQTAYKAITSFVWFSLTSLCAASCDALSAVASSAPTERRPFAGHVDCGRLVRIVLVLCTARQAV